jgi:mRNA interferase YafQ
MTNYAAISEADFSGFKVPNAQTRAADDAPLAPEWLDHTLKGEWADHRECHLGGDFLVIYQVEANWINFVRAGTHSEFFTH